MPCSYLKIKQDVFKGKMYRSQLSFILTGNGTQSLPMKGRLCLNLNAFIASGIRNMAINSVSRFGPSNKMHARECF